MCGIEKEKFHNNYNKTTRLTIRFASWAFWIWDKAASRSIFSSCAKHYKNQNKNTWLRQKDRYDAASSSRELNSGPRFPEPISKAITHFEVPGTKFSGSLYIEWWWK